MGRGLLVRCWRLSRSARCRLYARRSARFLRDRVSARPQCRRDRDVGAAAADDLAALKATFRRPATVPFPADNPFSEEKRALGEALFHDKRLSVDGSLRLRHLPRPPQGFCRRQGTGAACPGVRSSATRRPCGISPGRRRCSGTAARAASRSRSRARSNRRTRWRSRSPRVVARLAADPDPMRSLRRRLSR